MTEIPNEITTDSNIKLRILQPGDAPELFQLTGANRKRLGEWLPWVPYVKVEADSLSFIETGLADLENAKSFHYGIWYDGRLAGVIGAHTWIPDQKFLEIGYWIGKEFEGKGIMTRACQSLISQLFADGTVSTVQICCDPANTRSAAIPIRLKFEYVKRVKRTEGNLPHKIDVYQIASSAWEK